MSSRAGDAPGFQERRNAVGCGHDDKRDNEHQPAGAHGSGASRHFPGCKRRNCKENKAQNFMPKRMDRLHRGGKNVLHELACLPRYLLMGHDLILSKVTLVPASLHLYNQGNIYAPDTMRGTDGPVVASEVAELKGSAH